MKLYHYTTRKGKDGIMEDEVIYQSTNEITDCRFGKGVYLTSLDPYSNSKDDIAVNNYRESKRWATYSEWLIINNND